MLRLILCSGCNKASVTTHKCTGCDLTLYCSKECQEKDWVNHKHVCGQSMGDRAPITGSCQKCAKTGCSLRCSRCKTTFYCSKECQREDWKNHKVTDCKDSKPGNENNTATPSEDTDQGEQHRQHRRPFAPFGVPMFSDPVFPFRSPEMVHFEADRPLGSLEKAKSIVKRMFIFSAVIDDLDDLDDLDEVPFRRCYPFFIGIPETKDSRSIFVAFMFKYDPYAIRHGVYIKDKKDKVTKVVFNLDFENPFSYAQVKPGNYLCLLNSRIEGIRSRIRVNDPSSVFIIDGRSIT